MNELASYDRFADEDEENEGFCTAGQEDHSGTSSFLMRADKQLPAGGEGANQNAPATGAWLRWAVAARLWEGDGEGGGGVGGVVITVRYACLYAAGR